MEPMSRPERQRAQRATFRLPAPALLFPVLLMFCVTPLATSGGPWAVVFAIPALALAWVVVTRTKASPDGVAAYGLQGAKRMKWTELAGLEFNDARWAVAVALDGNRVRLPMVRPRDLPRLVAVSGGSLRLGFEAPPEALDDEQAAVDDETGGAATGGADVAGADVDGSDVDRAAVDGAAHPMPPGTTDEGVPAGNAPSADRSTGRRSDITADPSSAVR